MMIRIIKTWCCYSDPYDKQCGQVVIKNNLKVRCKRIGKYYCNKRQKYYCEMHIYQDLKQEESVTDEKKNMEKKMSFNQECNISMDSCYSDVSEG
jgi:hypothetical protein